MKVNWITVGGFAVSAIGAAAGFVGDIISKKQAVANLANSKEIKDMINEAVAEALKNVNK